MAITSSSISGTCLILSRARQPKAAEAAHAPGGSGRGPAGRPGGGAVAGAAGAAGRVVMTIPSWWPGGGPRGCRGGTGGGLAGEGEEHLVEARLAEGELADGDARPAEFGHRRRRLLAGRLRGAAAQHQLLQVPDLRPVLLPRRLEDPLPQPPYPVLAAPPVDGIPSDGVLARGLALRSVHGDSAHVHRGGRPGIARHRA